MSLSSGFIITAYHGYDRKTLPLYYVSTNGGSVCWGTSVYGAKRFMDLDKAKEVFQKLRAPDEQYCMGILPVENLDGRLAPL